MRQGDFEALLNSGEYIATRKIDGFRCLAVYFPQEGFSFFGRNRSVIDFQRSNFINQIFELSKNETKAFSKAFVLDGELYSTQRTVGNLSAGTILENVVKSGGEGLVLKKKTSKYYPISTRQGVKGDRDCWIKYKRTFSLARVFEGTHKDIDTFVVGYSLRKEGTENESFVLRNCCFVYYEETGKKHVIASIAGFPREERIAWVENAHVAPRLIHEMYGRVAVIDRTDVSSKSLAFTHARFVR